MEQSHNRLHSLLQHKVNDIAIVAYRLRVDWSPWKCKRHNSRPRNREGVGFQAHARHALNVLFVEVEMFVRHVVRHNGVRTADDD